ncbi:MAG: hypothetical protein HYZ45_14400 [Burkholderiales bacterium]|nr:hypothetical protein [Burkholderiales bacterium]
MATMKPWGRTLRTLGIAAGMGALPALNFLPHWQWLLQLVVLSCLLRLMVRLPRQQDTSEKVHRLAFIQGWAFGFGWIIASVYWLYIAMHRFGDMPAPLAVVALILFSLFIGIFPGLSLYAASKLRRDSSDTVYALAIIPACFALGEWLRGWFLTGFPWNVSGYAHVDSIFSGLFPLLGVYGTGWIALVFAGIAILASQSWRAKLINFSALVSFAIVCSLLGHIEWSQPQGQPIKVRLLQGNISQDAKFASERVIDSLQLYQRMIQQDSADLIATPETAFPTFMHMLPAQSQPLVTRRAGR